MGVSLDNVEFESEGHILLGRLYRPEDGGKRSAVVICHGYPGDTRACVVERIGETL